MPTAMTYNSLQQDIRDYLERGDSTDPTVFNQIPKLINLAERDIARSLKIQGFINVVTDTLSPGQSVYAKPDRWRDTVSMNFGVGVEQVRTPIFPRSYEYCNAYWPDRAVTDQPKFYADYNYFNWLIIPSPDVEYPIEILYYQQPPYLDDNNQTNWLTDFAPNALLHGALLQAEPYLKNDERIQVWATIYKQDLSILNEEDLSKVVDRNVSRQEA